MNQNWFKIPQKKSQKLNNIKIDDETAIQINVRCSIKKWMNFSMKVYQIQCDYTAEASRKHFKIHNFLSQLTQFLYIIQTVARPVKMMTQKYKINLKKKKPQAITKWN